MLMSVALMLVVAACDANGDDTADDSTEDTTELPADDAANGEEDAATPEETEDAMGTEDEALGEEDEDLTAAEGDDEASTEPEDEADGAGAETESEDEEIAQDDEMAVEDEEAVVDPDDMQPDPNQGIFFDLTSDEANEMTEFDIVEPEYVPEALEFQSIIGMASMSADPEAMEDEAATITFAYQQAPEEEMTPGLPVEFMQSTEIDMSEGLGPEVETEQLTIGDREVTRISVVQEMGDEILAFVWNENDVHYSLAAILGNELTEDELEEMIASVPSA